MTPRAATLLAICAGTTLGVVAAVVLREPPRRPRPAPVPAVTPAPAPSPSVPPPVAAPPSAAASASASAAPTDPGPCASVTLAPDQVESTALACARGSTDACFRVGVAQVYGCGVAQNEKAGLPFLNEARRRHEAACQKRDPAACLALADLYARGIGVPPNPATADALRSRARETCRTNAAPACSSLAGSDLP